ncbi:MAG: hypothetical protein RLZZ306_1612 [Bacteroidota bacterium]|jgi:hypothetical protein
MKNLHKLLFLALLLTFSRTHSQSTFSLKPSQNLKNLPALQSFVFGKSGNYWLLIGGRTNGFHGFSNYQDFPFKKANKFVYVYNTATNKLDSLSTAFLPTVLREQYTSSNMQHYQVGNYLYISGGYGEYHAKLPDSTFTTYSTLSRVNIAQIINAVLTKNLIKFRTSVVYAKDKLTASTGGEMYKLPDGKFYLVLGHRFYGTYSADSMGGKTRQVYLDSVHVFKLTETSSSIAITQGSRQYISDNLPDNTTQFRRRDLLVVPAIQRGGQGIGLTVYGGVFTSTGLPFRNPIYLRGGTTPSYQLDKTYTQTSNIYATANVEMYDATNDVMLTTAFGGIGEDTSTTTGSGDAFTKKIMTIKRNNRTNTTKETLNPTGTPTFMGSESIFISASNVPMYNANYDVMNYNAMPAGTPKLIGYIYGGIVSNGTGWSPSNPTIPSKMVYEVYFTK